MDRVAFRRFGSGPDLLLIMGQDGSMSWWEPAFLASLAQHYTVVIFDLPGVGYSQPAPAGLMTIDSMADDTAGLIEALGLTSPTVLGWGLGGDVALALAARHNRSVGDLVLVDTSAGGPSAAQPAASIQSDLASPSATAASLAAPMFGPSDSASAVTAESGWLTGVTVAVPDDVTQASINAEAAMQESVWSSDSLVAQASGLTSSTLVVFGTADVLFPPSNGIALAKLISGSQTLPLVGVGYACMFETPSSFVAALEQFTG
jgi:pimeloyl-ACP methyl ester carboxylesterase